MSESDDAETVAERRKRSGRPTGPTGPSRASRSVIPASSGTGPQARQALRAEEVARARGVALLLGGLAGVAGGWFPLLGGDPPLRIAATVACCYMTAVAALVFFRAKPDDRYTFYFRLFGWSCVAVSGPIQLYIGLFSPAPIVVMIGIGFFGTGDDRRSGIAICATAIAVYTALATMIALDMIPDHGLIRGLGIPAGRIFGVVMVPVAFVGFLRQALLARNATYAAVAQVEEAARVVQQREAQLAEINLDLERALEVGAGQRGRHTGRHAGRWVLGGIIGRGAMGEVYAAAHEETGQAAAVKTLVAIDDAAHLARFRREVDIASKLLAPGVVSLYDSGIFDDHTPYLVMELLTGHDLSWFMRKSRLELPETLIMCAQIAAGLREAHDAGIVHRDIKPQNLFRHERADGAPCWKILDFGVSKFADANGTLTQNLVIGTPGYMSPEQARGNAADVRSDLFSFGAVLYRALTGQPPFRGDDTPQILFDVVYRAPQQPSEVAPKLPLDVDAFLAIAIAKRPHDRFGSAIEVSAALDAAVRGELPDDVRAHATKVLARLPWGARLRD